MSAFYILGSCRGYNEAGPQPIPYSEIVAYLDSEGVTDPDERAETQRLLRDLDSRYLILSHEKMAQERERLLNKKR